MERHCSHSIRAWPHRQALFPAEAKRYFQQPSEVGVVMAPSGTVIKSAGGPLVTIAIPTFNRAALLRGCIPAVLAQTYDNIEVLVSDNASLDDTANVLREFSDKRIRVLRQETNIGLLPNWNACLAAARGEYVVFVSDDDRISPRFIERCVGVIGRQSSVPVVVTLTNCHLISFGQTKPARASRHIASGLRNGPDVLLEFLADEISVAMCSVMVRTEALRSRNGFPVDLPHTADVAAWAPLLLEGEVGFVNEACATFNLHDDSETGRLGVAQILADGWKVASLISRTADERIKDVSLRQNLKLQAQRCFSRRALRFLAYHRNSGASLLEVLAFVRRFRSDLMIVDKLSLLRFAAIILCPPPIAARLRQHRQVFSLGWRGRQAAVKPG
jgi:glycosyltransferase involved in cell wall biosynthesis